MYIVLIVKYITIKLNFGVPLKCIMSLKKLGFA